MRFAPPAVNHRSVAASFTHGEHPLALILALIEILANKPKFAAQCLFLYRRLLGGADANQNEVLFNWCMKCICELSDL